MGRHNFDIGVLVTSVRKDFKLLLESNSCQIFKVCLLKLVIIVYLENHIDLHFTKNPPYRRPNVIDLIHTNVYTMQTRIVGGALYFVTFIDDHSRKVWGFALKTKD